MPLRAKLGREPFQETAIKAGVVRDHQHGVRANASTSAGSMA